ncbi:hypothetical protein [Staphylococcus gallinarum]|uniref:hypothetical protein n=1 Tax=Staphylococcus gallinarum TaxID=1293 RepID=UPI002DBEB1C2|nr:hypothetical protein [Staphylococcus gallinarum]MEB7040087.1 hypothetical protein [Staphylococcus gallinarum]
MTDKQLLTFISDNEILDKEVLNFSSTLSLEENGLDSFDIMMITFELQEEYDVDLSNITKTDSINDILAIINAKESLEG